MVPRQRLWTIGGIVATRGLPVPLTRHRTSRNPFQRCSQKALAPLAILWCRCAASASDPSTANSSTRCVITFRFNMTPIRFRWVRRNELQPRCNAQVVFIDALHAHQWVAGGKRGMNAATERVTSGHQPTTRDAQSTDNRQRSIDAPASMEQFNHCQRHRFDSSA